MTPEKWERISEIYHSAAELKVGQREEYLEKVCGSDETLRREVESLLQADEDAGDFIAEPLVGNDPPKASSEPKPGDIFGHYKIERSIGSGGMGEVYLAIDSRLGRQVAIKTLPAEIADDPDHLKRFRNEALAAANINHPNAATIYSVEENGSSPFITMEYIEGQTLDQAVPIDGLPVETFVDWFAQLADALAMAHQKGVIHRDVKPGNIMVTGGKIPKILDFGLAQIDHLGVDQSDSDIHITKPGQIIGTPAYMSPEQAEGKAIDHRSDIFSFGVVMYEAITGQRPFTGDSHAEIISNLLRSDPEPLDRIRPDIPETCRKIISRCIRKSKAERFQSMREVADSLFALRSLVRSGRSFESFQKRLFREAQAPSASWIPLALFLVMLFAAAGWYLFSDQRPREINFNEVTFKRLSQSNNVAYAAISPNGRSVAYVTYEENGDRALWLRRVDETTSFRVVPPQQLNYWDCPIFSNDGEQIYFITANRSATHGALYRISTLGGPAKKLAEKVNHLGSISPDGQRISLIRYGDPHPSRSVNTTDARLITINAVDGGEEQEHAVVEGESVMREPKFSIDGKTIIFVKRELENGIELWSINRLDLKTGIQTLILRQRERIGEINPIARTSGLMMTAADPASNRRQIFHVSLTDGKVSRVTNDLNSYIGVSIDSVGKNVVTAQRAEEGRVWVGNSNDMASMEPLTRESLAHQVVDWTPDGRIVYDAYENSRLSILIADADGKNATQLTPSDSDNSEPKVSGDGRFIAFTSRRAGFNQIWRMNIDGSVPTLLADVPGLTQAPRFAADGKTVVFRWFEEGSPPVAQVPIEGGQVSGIDYLSRSLIYYWAMSPDGRMVAYTFSEDNSDNLKVAVGLTDPGSNKTILDIWPSRIFKWMPDGKSLLYQEKQKGENLTAKVFEIPIERPEPKLLLSTEPENILDMSFSRDGTRVAVIRQKTTTDAVLLSTGGNPAN